MSIKNIVLAAAAVVAVTSTYAAADNYFEYGDHLDKSANLELGLVRADGDGVVEIYDEVAGEAGVLLGTTSVNAGANSDVDVNLGQKPLGDVIAVIKVDGQVVAEKQYEVN